MRVPNGHLEALIKHFQADDDRLDADGIYGPQTAAALDGYISDNTITAPGLTRMHRAFISAFGDLGMGEVPPGSNGGPYVDSLRKEVGLPRLAGGEWCSVFLSVHLHRCGIPIKSRSARGLMRALEALAGAKVVKMDCLYQGLYALSLLRRGQNSHHIQLIKVTGHPRDLQIRHVGGNEKHHVGSDKVPVEDYLKSCLRIVTYEG